MEEKTIIISLAGVFVVLAGVVFLVTRNQPSDPLTIETEQLQNTLNTDDASMPVGGADSYNTDQSVDTTNTHNYATMTGTIQTNKGAITIELFSEQMPKTVGNFIKLAREGYYNGIKIHRVEPNFVVQFGDPLTKELDLNDPKIGTGGPGYAIEDEFVDGLSNLTGTLAMANSGPNTGGSQIFINLSDNTFLDFDKEPLTSKHPVFGRVSGGMDVVRLLERGDVITSITIQ